MNLTLGKCKISQYHIGSEKYCSSRTLALQAANDIINMDHTLKLKAGEGVLGWQFTAYRVRLRVMGGD